jgi:hypothetical protein
MIPVQLQRLGLGHDVSKRVASPSNDNADCIKRA